MFRFLKRKLGIAALEQEIAALRTSIPALDARNRQVLTAIESLMQTLQIPTADDSLIMYHLRCMGYCGGWKVKELQNNAGKDAA